MVGAFERRNDGAYSNHRLRGGVWDDRGGTREQEPLTFQRLRSVRGTLYSGDYSVAGLTELFAIERKSVADLVGCCMGENRTRFERELHRLRGYRFNLSDWLLSEPSCKFNRPPIGCTSHQRPLWRRWVHLRLVMIARWCFKHTYESAAHRIESWAFWFAREMVETVNDVWRSVRRLELDEDLRYIGLVPGQPST